MVNKVILVGRVGRDAELKYHNGSAHSSFSIATTERWTDKNREKQEKTEWHNCIIWGKMAEILSQYIKKGNLIYAEGKIQTREWEDDSSAKHKAISIVVSSVQFLNGGQRRDNKNGGDQPAQDNQSAPPPVSEEDLPF